MKVWTVRHVAFAAAMTLAAAMFWSGCRQDSAPDAAKNGSSAGGAAGQSVAEGNQAATTTDANQAGTVPQGSPVENTAPVTQAEAPAPATAPAPVTQVETVAQAKQPEATASRSQTTRSEVSQPRVAQPVVLPVGTALEGSLEGTVSTDKSRVGDVVSLKTTEAVLVNGRTVVPVGSTVHGTVTHVRAAGRMKGAAELTIRFTELQLPSGERFPITCDPYRRVVKGDGKETAAEIGGAATVGGILGGVVGAGKGDALKGAAIGAAVGTGVAASTKGDQIVLPAGKTFTVRLTAPVTLTSTSTTS